ncbi:hypothetical protein DFA_06916 [Cavenderia fasciculata]|uniref:Pectin lyase-like family protein n=1 Tax=Cavenderia fasciculata TaxID=261658 RepID=F4PX11_CACFS|nr:uncharacterized protein DFA_06916 [Cavenderia fasciculata]EGG19814.1 hypothetical protein DFA_06916 [Cavenderia fasciculata]|eukprot:XP_004358160.1 hypothetical protein DFA_06916 [Cavenderia fasciculata]
MKSYISLFILFISTLIIVAVSQQSQSQTIYVNIASTNTSQTCGSDNTPINACADLTSAFAAFVGSNTSVDSNGTYVPLTIIMSPGTYTGDRNANLTIYNQTVTITTASTTDNVTIDLTNNNALYFISTDLPESLGNVSLTDKTVVTLKGLNVVNFFTPNVQTTDTGVIISANSSASTVLTLESYITLNTVSKYGQIYATDASIVYLSNTTFVSNIAANGTSISSLSGSTFYIADVMFWSNIARDSGGAIYATDQSVFHINNTDFEYNKAANNGGAIFMSACAFTMSNVTFNTNTANNGGMVSCTNASTILFDKVITNGLNNDTSTNKTSHIVVCGLGECTVDGTSNTGGTCPSDDDSGNGLSNKVIAAITVGVVAGVAVLGCVIFVFYKRRKNQLKYGGVCLAGGTVYVDQSSTNTDATCGSSEEDACQDLESAFAVLMADADTSLTSIFVASGTYTGVANGNIQFYNRSVTIYGNGETVFDMTGVTPYFFNLAPSSDSMITENDNTELTINEITIINFDGSLTNGSLFYSYSESVYVTINIHNSNFTNITGSIAYINNVEGFTMLGSVNFDGCIFTNVTSTTQPAIQTFLVQTTIIYCTFTQNDARYLIYVSFGALTVTKNVFTNNNFTNLSVGALICGTYIRSYPFVVTSNIFDNNQLYGSAILSYTSLMVSIKNNVFSNSQSNAVICGSSDITINNCTFTNNTGNTYGQVHSTGYCNVDVLSSNFTSNSAQNGAAISSLPTGASTTISASSSNFINNTAVNGGAIYMGQTVATLLNVVLNQNKASGGASTGGAIYIYQKSDISFINVTLNNNVAISAPSIYCDGNSRLFFGENVNGTGNVDHNNQQSPLVVCDGVDGGCSVSGDIEDGVCGKESGSSAHNSNSGTNTIASMMGTLISVITIVARLA